MRQTTTSQGRELGSILEAQPYVGRPVTHPLPRVLASLTAAAGSVSPWLCPGQRVLQEQLFLESQAVSATRVQMQTMPGIQVISSHSDFSLRGTLAAQRLGHTV